LVYQTSKTTGKTTANTTKTSSAKNSSLNYTNPVTYDDYFALVNAFFLGATI